jgi:excisionase family DNA binding protein
MKRHTDTNTPGSGQSDVFNEAEAAAYLHITKRTCREWRATRGLPACKPTPKVTLYRKSDIDAWLEHSRVAFPPRARRVAPVVPPPRQKCPAAAPESEAGHE